MKWLQIVFAAVFVFGMVACEFTEQDPLAKESDSVKKGEVPSKAKPPEEKPLPSDVLRIDGADYFVFRENVEQEISIKGRSAFDQVKYNIEITNPDDFKGATIEMVEGDVALDLQAEVKFKWTPPKGIVYSDVISYTLDTMIYTTNLSENYSFKKSFNIFIYKETFVIPEVLSVDKVTSAVKEGSTAKFKVTVLDADGTNSTPPNLMALTDFTDKNGAPYLSWAKPTQDPSDPTIWVFDVTIDLRNVEITAGSNIAQFSIAAVSSAGKKSPPKKGQYTVWSSIMAPVTSWLDAVEFKIGKDNHFDFSIIDPRGEGKLTAQFITTCSSLPGAPICACTAKVGVSGKANTLSACSIDWSVPADTIPQDLKILFKAENSSTLFGDSEKKVVNFAGLLKLVP